ncbi:MAG: iron ABC transporter permease [Fibrobacteres bacterium]|nr:iron ABC transporter permease [Fibrobacterota bacterium]
MKLKFPLVLTTLFAFLIGIILICPMIGQTFTPWSLIFSADTNDLGREILLKTRIPRMLLGILVGASLAVSGAVFQSVFRNALATPFTLGTASGGSFGAVIAIKLGLDFNAYGFSSVTLMAFAGSFISLLIVYWLSRHRGGITTSTMLLAGVTIGFFFNALSMFTHYMMDYTQSYRVVIWTMGSLDITDYAAIVRIAPVIVISLAGSMFLGRNLNQLCLGEDIARTRGVDVEKTKRSAFILTSLMIGASVSVAGPIGFVGLIVPHALRLVIGADYRLLLPASMLAGSAFLVACDTVARLVILPSELPVGVVTALIGGPFFLWLLLRKSPENF